MTPQKPKINMRTLGSPLRDRPECLDEFTENLVDEEASASGGTPASNSCEPLHQELSRKVVSGKHSLFVHLQKDRNCAVRKRTKMIRAPRRKRTGNQVPRAKEFGDLITADHRALSEDCESQKKSPIRSHCMRLGHLMVAILSVPNQIVSGNRKEFTKVSRSDSPAESHLYSQFIGVWQSPVKSYPGIIVHLRLTVPRQMTLLKGRYVESRKELLQY